MLPLFPPLQKKNEKGVVVEVKYELETMSSKDAMRFPLIGSAFLFSLYIIYKLVPKEWVTFLLNLYLLVFGMASLIACFRPLYSRIFSWFSQHEASLPVWQVRIPYFMPGTFLLHSHPSSSFSSTLIPPPLFFGR